MKNNYQRILTFYYQDDRTELYTKKTSLRTMERAMQDLEDILSKRTGTNADNWTIKEAVIINKESGEVLIDRDYM